MVHYIENCKLNEEVLKSQKNLIIVDFFATWCGPCQMLTPVLDNISKNFEENVDIFKVNIDENQESAIRYGVVSVPTLIFFKDCKEIERQIGYMEESELNGLINQLL